MPACGPYGPRGFESLSRRHPFQGWEMIGSADQMNKRIYILLLALITLSAFVPVPARAAPALTTDKTLYTVRDQQVLISGSGLSQGQTYYVWIRTPTENRTSYTGISFQPVSGGLVPPDIAYALTPNATLGTYVVRLSTSGTVDNMQATAHFGIWGTAAPVYERTQTVNLLGGGIFPGTGLRLAIQDPSGNTVQQATLASSTNGDFNDTWRIPPNSATNIYTAIVQGTGSFDNPQADILSEAKFTVTAAALSLKVTQEPNSTYQRTQNAAFSIMVQYPDASPVTSSLVNLPVTLLQSQSTVGFVNFTITNAANGIWMAETRIQPNATLSSQYRFEIPAMSFDDGYGNKGGTAAIYSNYFTVTNASLSITSQLNGTNIQIPFGQVSIISRVAYPNGSPMTTGTVTVVVSAGASVSQLPSTYDPTIGEWRASYSSTLLDLARVGTWRLRVTAEDSFGNMGTATYDLTAQPYLFLVLLASVIVVVFVARWSISRYGRRLYFRVRKLLRRPRYRQFG